MRAHSSLRTRQHVHVRAICEASGLARATDALECSEDVATRRIWEVHARDRCLRAYAPLVCTLSGIYARRGHHRHSGRMPGRSYGKGIDGSASECSFEQLRSGGHSFD